MSVKCFIDAFFPASLPLYHVAFQAKSQVLSANFSIVLICADDLWLTTAMNSKLLTVTTDPYRILIFIICHVD